MKEQRVSPCHGVQGQGSFSVLLAQQAAAVRAAWEDAYFVERLQQLGHSVMPASRARHLFVERAFGLGDATEPLGLHKAYAYLSPPRLDRILAGLERCYDHAPERDRCPAVSALSPASCRLYVEVGLTNV